MKSTNAIKLESIIRSKTIPKTLVYISLVSVLLISGLLYFSYLQTESHHKNYLTRFTTHLESRINGIQSELSNLAQNDLIINSLIDVEFQKRSLPVFIRSLKLSVNPVEIGFSDFKGNIITANTNSLTEHALLFPEWKTKALEAGESFIEFNSGTVLIAEPVIYAQRPEAALIIYIKNISDLIGTLPQASNDFILTDENDFILFSTNPSDFPIGNNILNVNFDNLYITEESLSNWKLISTEPLWDSYKGLLPLVIFLFIGLIGVVLATISGVRIASKQAAKAVHDLQVTLADSASTSIKEINSHGNPSEDFLETHLSEIHEFIEIQTQFSTLLQNLNSTSLSRNTLAGVVNSLDEVLLVLSCDQDVILQNRRLEKLLLDLDLILPKDIFRLIPQSFLIQEAESEFHECSYDPEQFPSLKKAIEFKWQRHLYKNDLGEHLGFTLSGNDITQDKELETELLIKHKAIDEANTSIIISEVRDGSFPIIYLNKAFEKLTGYDKEMVLGREYKILQGPNTEKEKLEQIQQALEQSTPLSIILTNYRKDGSEFQNQLTLSPIFDQDGYFTHVIGLLEDVSEREKANNLIRVAKIKAEESAKLKSEFLASMSHEIRTPMNGILGMLNIVKATKLEPSQKQQLRLAEQSAESLLVIINDILDFSKIEAGKLHLEPIEFDIYQEIHGLIQNLAGSALKKGIRFIVDLSGLVSPYMIGDPTRIRQILTNLISNAVKFTEHGSITINMRTKSYSSNKIKLYVEIIDQGIGIASDSLEKIFDTFTQADSSTTRQYGGTGLGLPISRQLCRMMDGEIEAKSELGIGSTFSFHLSLMESKKTFSPPVLYQDNPVFILDSIPNDAKVLEQQLVAWQSDVSICDSIDGLKTALEDQKTAVIFIDEETLNSLNDSEYSSLQNAIGLIAPSTIIISTMTLNPYINHSLFGELSRHTVKYLLKPLTAKNLIDCIQGEENSTNNIEIATDAYKSFADKQFLLVEDNQINQIVAKNILLSFGAKVTIAKHGLEAINILQKQPNHFDLILMDCQMPEMDGYEASSLIRQQKAGDCYTNIPIIALTANALTGDREKCLDAGMNDHVSKPIDIQELKNTLNTWLNASNSNEIEELEVKQIPQREKQAEQGKDPDKKEVWNEAEMLHRIANNKSLALQLVQVFCLDVEDIYADLITAQENMTLKELAFTAHTLKGVASNISGLKLAHICAKIEKDAKDGITEHINFYIKQVYPAISELKKVLEKASLKWVN